MTKQAKRFLWWIHCRLCLYWKLPFKSDEFGTDRYYCIECRTKIINGWLL